MATGPQYQPTSSPHEATRTSASAFATRLNALTNSTNAAWNGMQSWMDRAQKRQLESEKHELLLPALQAEATLQAERSKDALHGMRQVRELAAQSHRLMPEARADFQAFLGSDDPVSSGLDWLQKWERLGHVSELTPAVTEMSKTIRDRMDSFEKDQRNIVERTRAGLVFDSVEKAREVAAGRQIQGWTKRDGTKVYAVMDDLEPGFAQQIASEANLLMLDLTSARSVEDLRQLRDNEQFSRVWRHSEEFRKAYSERSSGFINGGRGSLRPIPGFPDRYMDDRGNYLGTGSDGQLYSLGRLAPDEAKDPVASLNQLMKTPIGAVDGKAETLAQYVGRTRNEDGTIKRGGFFGVKGEVDLDPAAEQLLRKAEVLRTAIGGSSPSSATEVPAVTLPDTTPETAAPSPPPVVAPAETPLKEFATPEEAEAAMNQGELQPGQEILINGQRFKVEE